MSLKRTSRLVASAAVSAGLAFGGLALTAPAANAATATGTATYTCKSPLGSLPPPLNALGTFTVPATFSLENLPGALTANVPIPAGTPVIGTLQFPTPSSGLPGILSVVANTLTSILGPTPLSPLAVQFSGATATISGQLGSAFNPTSDLPLPIPTSFDAGLLINGLQNLGVKCTLNPGSTVVTSGGGAPGSTNGLAKQNAKVKAKGTKVVKQGKKAVVKVKVKTSAGQKGVGQVTAKVKGLKAKTKELKNGKVRFIFKGLKLGTKKIKFAFLGNSYTNSAKKKFTVRVVR